MPGKSWINKLIITFGIGEMAFFVFFPCLEEKRESERGEKARRFNDPVRLKRVAINFEKLEHCCK